MKSRRLIDTPPLQSCLFKRRQDSTLQSKLRLGLRCRAGAIRKRGVWYDPGVSRSSASRRIAPGTQKHRDRVGTDAVGCAFICTQQGGFVSGERVERRLAAVLAADVAGYSRLMGRDEEGTLARLKSVRKSLVDPAIAAHRGRIVKTTGDGMLVEFASAVDAARCAMELQRGVAAQNADVPQERKI